MTGLGIGLIAWSLLVSGCGSSDRDTSCDAIERKPTPVSGPNMSELEATKEAITDFAVGNPVWQINMVDADETTGTVVVGTSLRDTELCGLLHKTFGRFVQVIHMPPGLTGVAVVR